MPVTPDQFSNNGYSSVAGGAGGRGTALGPSDTTLYLPVGDGAKMPAAVPFMVQLTQNGSSSTNELAKCSAIAGDVLTLVRGQEGTTARQWVLGSTVEQVVTAGNLSNLWTQVVALQPAAGVPYFNVKNYGAVGNGSTDDTSAITSAISAATSAGGGTVYLPVGTYKITSSLSVPANVWLAGDGPNASVLSAGSATADMVVLNGADSGVRDLGFTAAAGFRTAGAAINIAAQVYDLRVARVVMYNQYNGIVIGNGTLIPNVVFLTDLRIWNTTNACITNNSGQNLFLSNINGSNDTPSTGQYGFLWTGGNSVWCSQVTFFQLGRGFYISPSSTNTVQYGWLTACSADTCDTFGFELYANTGTVKDIELVNCWGSNGQRSGLLISAGTGTLDDVSVIGFRAQSNHQNGIEVDSGVNVDISGARLTGNSAGNVGLYQGVYIAPGVTKFSVTNSRIGTFDGFGASQQYGIQVDAGASTEYLIAGNDVTGNGTAGIHDTGTGTNKKIANNLGYNPVGKLTAQPAVPASGVAYTNASGVDCTVYLTGGTFTAAHQIGGQSIGNSTATLLRVPAGQSVTLTYSAAPTWVWMGD